VPMSNFGFERVMFIGTNVLYLSRSNQAQVSPLLIEIVVDHAVDIAAHGGVGAGISQPDIQDGICLQPDSTKI
jgi:hypothetical protein